MRLDEHPSIGRQPVLDPLLAGSQLGEPDDLDEGTPLDHLGNVDLVAARVRGRELRSVPGPRWFKTLGLCPEDCVFCDSGVKHPLLELSNGLVVFHTKTGENTIFGTQP